MKWYRQYVTEDKVSIVIGKVDKVGHTNNKVKMFYTWSKTNAMLGMYFVSKSNIPVSTNIRSFGVQYINRIVVV